MSNVALNHLTPSPAFAPLSRWQIIALPFIAGGVAGLGFGRTAGIVLVLAGLAFFARFLSQLNVKQACTAGFTFGLGFFLAGVHWLYVSLHDIGGMPAPMAALAILGFCAYLAVYPMLAAGLAARLTPLPRPVTHAAEALQHVRASAILGSPAHGTKESTSFRLLVALPALWVLCEWLRATVFTGFPWLTVGYAGFTDMVLPVDPFSGLSQSFGVYARSWLVMFCAALIALGSIFIFKVKTTEILVSKRALIFGGAGLMSVLALGVVMNVLNTNALKPVGKLSAALIQGNVLQTLKWKEGEREKAIENYVQAIKGEKAQLIVIPETALPVFIDDLPRATIDTLTQHAIGNGGDVVLGTLTRKFNERGFTYFNSAVSTGSTRTQIYSKTHLVPFGEFIPPMFAWAYQWLNIPMSGMARGASGQKPLNIAGAKIAINICYEDVFGSEISRPLPEAELLLNLTNIAWFGRSIAAEQHMQMAKQRSIENGRWTLRATNTGVTAVIDESGRTVSQLPQFENAVLRAQVTRFSGVTTYANNGDAPWLFLCIAMLGVVMFFNHRAARVTPF